MPIIKYIKYAYLPQTYDYDTFKSYGTTMLNREVLMSTALNTLTLQPGIKRHGLSYCTAAIIESKRVLSLRQQTDPLFVPL